jgi:hypothetical protein
VLLSAKVDDLNSLQALISLGLLRPVCHTLMLNLIQTPQHFLVRLESRLHLEQLIHPLERDTLGLWDQEVNVWDGQ